MADALHGAAAPIPSAVLASTVPLNEVTTDPVQLLRQFDCWLENTGHGADHPWRLSISRCLNAVDQMPSPAAADAAERRRGPSDAVEDRLLMELQPVLSGLALLTNTLRVLHDLQAGAQIWPELAAGLSNACPTWLDPFAAGDERSAEYVLCDLARYAAALGTSIRAAAQEGGAA